MRPNGALFPTETLSVLAIAPPPFWPALFPMKTTLAVSDAFSMPLNRMI